MSNNFFVKASKLKLRFPSNRGLVSTELLWDLELTELDRMAIELASKQKETVSFISKEASLTESDELRLEILKYVIKERLDATEKAKQKAENLKEKRKLQSLLQEKEDEDLKKLTREEIKKKLEELNS